MTARELFHAGKLSDALKGAADEVKRNPRDAEARGFFSALLCFNGDWERADKHLDMLAEEATSQGASVALFRQLIRGETARQDFHTQGRIPEFLSPPPPDHIQTQLRASIELREGHTARAMELLEQAREQRPPLAVSCDGVSESEFHDCDELCAPVLEVITSTGKFYWVPLEMVKTIEFDEQKSARDRIWRPAELSIHGGPDGHVFIPSLYAGTIKHADEALRLGLTTDWPGEDSEPFRGVGLRLFQVGNSVVPITELKSIQITRPG